jgi:hypothetical protein
LNRIETGIKKVKGQIKEVKNKMETNKKEVHEKIANLRMYIVAGLLFLAKELLAC